VEDLVKLLDVKDILICSMVSWGLVQAVKPVLKSKVPPALSSSILRAIAILAGAGVGFSLDQTASGVGIGAACGTMSTFTVALIKRMVSSKAEVDLKELEDGPDEEPLEEDS